VTDEEKELLGREVLGHALSELRARVHLAAGRAMASALLDKPEREVTDGEAERALAWALDPANSHPLTWSAARAGVVGAVQALGGLFPAPLANLLSDTFRALEESEARGLAIPAAPPARGSGEPSRYGPPSRRSDLGRWLVREIGFQVGFIQLSFDAALGLVTGVIRDRKPSPHGPPTLPLGGDWRAVWRFVDRAKADHPHVWAEAVGAGEKWARGEIDASFMAQRQETLALAADAAAWSAVLKSARMLSAGVIKP
jgi:hypothetical protein